MKTHRATTTATLMALALFLAAPVGVRANSLLSGYGGPGQGNQAILGSALLNGPRSGGGASNAGAGGASRAAGGSSAASASGSSAPAGSSGAGAKAHPSGGPARSRQHASGSPVRPYTSPSRFAQTPSAVRDSETVGLSGDDLLYILLAFGALVLTALITRRLARPVR